MKIRSAKNKGRRLQVRVAEWLARHLGLTIVAVPPTKPGSRRGVTYVPEGCGDILVRPMSQPGLDVVFLSDRAKLLASKFFGVHVDGIECKNNEKLMRSLLSFKIIGQNGVAKLVSVFFNKRQAITCISANRMPMYLMWPSIDIAARNINCPHAVSGVFAHFGSYYDIIAIDGQCDCIALTAIR